MDTVFFLLCVQALLGALDNLWHHELQARLPQRASARHELALHALREALYGCVFLGLAWFEWHGAFALVPLLLLAGELAATLADFAEEDRTRRLPPFERQLHTLLCVLYGIFLAVIAPVLLGWARLQAGVVFTPHAWVSGLLSCCGVVVLAWSLRNALAVRALGRADTAAAPALPQMPSHLVAPAVLVAGATGFIGRALVARLHHEGRRVIVLSRDLQLARALFPPGVWAIDSLDAIPAETRIDAVVNLAGARVLGLPWTRARRRVLLGSRTGVASDLLVLMRRLLQPPRVLVAASAVGYYGASPGTCTEDTLPRPAEFQSALCAAVEHDARRAEVLGVRVVCLRLGLVLGRGDGAWPMLALAARLGLGAVLGDGRQPVPWIHLEDALGLVCHALARADVASAVNAVAPDLPPQSRFVQAMAASFGRRARLRLPAAPLRLLMGEMSTLLLDGQHAMPQAALAAGYVFRFPQLNAACADLAGRPARPASSRAARDMSPPLR
ncbi:MAG: TIGR01777 family protein [Aquabacterium sp.]|nr:MAG: TIGR01777 family protein [Aquabacterium sp.]